MGMKHKHQSVAVNDGTKEISSTRWNDDHEITDFLAFPNIADPAPPVGGLLIYCRSLAGRSLLRMIGAAGFDTAVQVALHGNAIYMLNPSNSTSAPGVFGGAVSTAVTISHVQTFASSSRFQATRRTRFTTSATAGVTSGCRQAYRQWFRGNAAGFGGFFFRSQFGANINLNGGQKFCGLCESNAALAGDPSALVNMIGMGYDAADPDTGNWFFMRNDSTGVATKIDLGVNAARANITHGYDLVMFNPPNSGTMFVQIVNLHTGVIVLEASYTVDVPDANWSMSFKCEVRNGSIAAADSIDLAKAYVESDY